MSKFVVVVESPAKAKTLGSYLGSDYKVIASYGHIRDLPSKDGSVDVGNHYHMVWQMNDRGRKQIKEISEALSGTENLYLATDPDREGEAISWHILESLKAKKLLQGIKVQRVVFHEITKSAIKHAFDTPKELDMNMVNAYLARRVLDYLVGFSLSPILWRKLPGAKSAGRVQSVALRLIVERELEIQAFNSEEYWSIHGDFAAEHGVFNSNLTYFDGKKIDKLDIKNEAQVTDIKSILEKEQYKIEKIEKKSVKRNPYAPFTTSSLQQDAVRKLGFSAKKTMQVAQKLYEGISVDGTMTGLITYMRTDSTALSSDAINDARDLILRDYGDKYLPKSPRVYKTKTKNAQEAHEAIRPTSFSRLPSNIKGYLSDDESKLYDLIWKRALASQMETALIDQVSVDVVSKSGNAKLKATGSTVGFDGFLKIYVESTDDDDDESQKNNDTSKKLPKLIEGEDLDVKSIFGNQHFTQPPARFNEASLVKKLEDLGIGRPSTYATIINVLQERQYVMLQKKVFIPLNIGFMTTSFLRNFFTKYVQYDFTANLEENLDDISNGTVLWEDTLNDFWVEFNAAIQSASGLTITSVIDTIEKDIENFVFQDFKEDRHCPLCKKGDVHLKLGRYGAFLGCSLYPECKFVRKINGEEQGASAMPTEAIKNELGTDPNHKNDKVFTKKGPYGYYFEWEKTKDAKNSKKPKRLGIPKCITSPEELTIADALKIDSLPHVLGTNELTGEDIMVCLGRFGPFIKVGKQSYKIEDGSNFFNITLDEAKKIIERASVE